MSGAPQKPPLRAMPCTSFLPTVFASLAAVPFWLSSSLSSTLALVVAG